MGGDQREMIVTMLVDEICIFKLSIISESTLKNYHTIYFVLERNVFGPPLISHFVKTSRDAARAWPWSTPGVDFHSGSGNEDVYFEAFFLWRFKMGMVEAAISEAADKNMIGLELLAIWLDECADELDVVPLCVDRLVMPATEASNFL